MTDEEIELLKRNRDHVYWAPDEDTFRKIYGFAEDWDDEGPVAFLSKGQYVALINCELSDFMVAVRLNLQNQPSK